MSLLDEISPPFAGGRRITLTVSPTTGELRANRAIQIDIDYSDADSDGGVMLPMELIVRPPTERSGFVRKVFRRVFPKAVTIFPLSEGTHLVTMREISHNRFFGSLFLEIEGDPLNEGLGRVV